MTLRDRTDDKTATLLGAFQSVCLAPEVRDEDVAVLESPTTSRARFELYRDLVRTRLRDLVTAAFPRTTAAVGRPRMLALADRHVTEAPPRSRFFREHAAEFGAWALLRLEAEPEPAYAPDLLRLETAQWRANYTPSPPPDGLVDFDLEAIAVPSATLVVLTTRYAVHRAEDPGSSGIFRLAVYRRPDHRVETRWMEPIWADLLEDLARGERPAIVCVRELLERHRRAADATFVDELTSFLARLVENGALLGSRR